MGWQQWATFQKHQDRFLNPIEFTKKYFASDDVTVYGKKFEEVKKLFKKPTRLTYVSEAIALNNGTREMHFALTQNYLSPNLLFRNNATPDSIIYDNYASPIIASPFICDTIVYNLYATIHLNPATNYHLNNGWHIVKDFNNGIIILAK